MSSTNECPVEGILMHSKSMSVFVVELAELVALERAHEEETQYGNLAYDGPGGQLPLLEQIGLIPSRLRRISSASIQKQFL